MGPKIIDEGKEETVALRYIRCSHSGEYYDYGLQEYDSVQSLSHLR
jgi:hypothetical protein